MIAEEITGVKEQVNELHRKENEIRNGKRKRKGEFEELIQRIDIFQNEIILTRTMTEAFLDKVIVYDKFHIEIRWAWQNLIADMGLLEEVDEEMRAAAHTPKSIGQGFRRQPDSNCAAGYGKCGRCDADTFYDGRRVWNECLC